MSFLIFHSLPGLDIAEQIMEPIQGNCAFKKYVIFFVQLAHFEGEMVSSFSYAEIAVAAILLTSDLFQDAAIVNTVPEVLLSERVSQAAEFLGRLASRKGVMRLPTDFVAANQAASGRN